VAMVRRTASFALADGREVVVRSTTPSDARRLRTLLDEVGAESEPTIVHVPGSCSVRTVRGRIAASAAEPGTLMLTALVDSRLVGHLALVTDERASCRHVCDLGLAVVRDERGLGIGSALLDVALPWAARSGVTKATVGVLAHNERALRFFRSHGFVSEGVRLGQHRRNGSTYDETLLARRLETTPATGR